MKTAWRGAVEPIVASAATVILGLLCLLLSDLGNTSRPGTGRRPRHRRRPGVGADLPACGAPAHRARGVLAGRPAARPRARPGPIGTRGLWGRVAALVGSHPARIWVLTLTALLALAALPPDAQGRRHQPVRPLPRRGRVRDGSGGAGQALPGGLGQPDPGAGAGGQRPKPCSRPGARGRRQRPVCRRGTGSARAKVVDGQVHVQATLTDAADSPAADDVVQRLRADLDAVGDDVLVGGQTAMNLDVRDASNRDLRTDHPRDPGGDLPRAGAAAARRWWPRCSWSPRTWCRSPPRWGWRRSCSTTSSTSPGPTRRRRCTGSSSWWRWGSTTRSS